MTGRWPGRSTAGPCVLTGGPVTGPVSDRQPVPGRVWGTWAVARTDYLLLLARNT